MVIQEQYPDLKSNANFLALQSQLEGTENRISVARTDYNEAVQSYNTSLRTFPTSIWAGTFYRSQKPALPFQAAAAAQTAPSVTFDAPPPPKVQ
jgi:LemA protein